MGLTSRARDEKSHRLASDAVTWFDREAALCEFQDARLGERFRMLLKQIGGDIGQSIPMVCQDWANTKAAYRFFSNERVSEADILSGHFKSTRERIAAAKGPVLVLHDTTEFTYQRERPDLIGMIKRIPKSNSRRLDGKPQTYTTCGILMHSSLAVTLEGLPLGLSAVKFWTRKKFRGVAALRREVNLTRIPIETKESIRWLENLKQSTELFEKPSKCIHIGDREADIYELFCAAQEVGTHFVVRTCVNRLAGDGDHTVATIMDEVAVKGLHRIEVQDSKGNPDQAVLEIRYRKIRILPPIGKQSRYPALTLTVIHADERGAPKNRKKIEWKLLTDLPVQSRGDAIEKLEWYSLRWKIEVFHKILKSGCRAEDSQLRTAQRLTNLISVFCIVSWRIFWMTMLNRSAPNASPEFALTKAEIQLLDRLVKDKNPGSKRKTLSHYLIKIARLGGYLARANDPPPGNLIMWRGLSRFIDIATGAKL
ncbi:IS4 family transposase [Bradyrhizobium sp. NC92]|uniref:IS4 family transposase n=1 Tax=Bradyrhizobium sp. (strain NC92) TaxID=55395 RepID=UPI0021AA92CD|nr:IS4 family transposase [Bradyrhizobium sp. NC92]UWU68180.1 IS4 family transposase [Bradyrhizobium sp. NC92]